MKNETEKIEHLDCAICETQLSYFNDEDELSHHTFFEVSRSYHELYIEDSAVDDDTTEKNTKMLMLVCKKCFDTVLSESPTLRSLFQHPNGDVVY